MFCCRFAATLGLSVALMSVQSSCSKFFSATAALELEVLEVPARLISTVVAWALSSLKDWIGGDSADTDEAAALVGVVGCSWPDTGSLPRFKRRMNRFMMPRSDCGLGPDSSYRVQRSELMFG